MRTALLEAGSTALLAGYCHYLPFFLADGQVRLDPSLNDAGLGRSVLLAFAAGLAACDRVLVHSPGSAGEPDPTRQRPSIEHDRRTLISS